MDGLMEHPDVACTQNIPAGGQRQPEVIVGTVRTYASPRRWMLPMLPHRFERAARGGCPSEATQQITRVIGVSPDAEPEDDLALLPVGKFERNLDRGTRIQRRSHGSGKPRTGHRRRALQRAVAP